MKNFLFVLSGLAAAGVYVLVTRARMAPRPVEDLAHKLQDAWVDHHTVA